MADDSMPTGATMYCEGCECETPHAVTIELRTRRDQSDRTVHRVPYRTAKCRACGEASVQPVEE